MVSHDEKYQNAMRNSDEQEARTENERAVQKAIFSIMSDNMELFKQFQDNPSFNKWLVNMVFNLTYNKEGKPYALPDEFMAQDVTTKETGNYSFSSSVPAAEQQAADLHKEYIE